MLTKRAHNDPLQVWIELGIAGFVVVVIILFTIIRTSFIAIRSSSHDYLRKTAVFLSVAIIGTIAFSIVSFPFQMPIPAFYFWLFVGLIEACTLKEPPTRPAKKSPAGNKNKAKAYITGAALLFAVTLSYIFTFREAYASYHFRKGMDNIKVKNYQNALLHFDSSLKTKPYHYLGSYLKGECLTALNQIDEAVDAYKNSLQYSNYHLSHYRLAATYSTQKQFEKAVAELESCIAVFPYFEDAAVLLGGLYLQENKNVLKARILFNEALQINGNNEFAHQGLGLIYRYLGKNSEAKQEFFRVLSTNNQNTTALKTLSQIYLEEKDFRNAYNYLISYDKLITDAFEKEWVKNNLTHIKEFLTTK